MLYFYQYTEYHNYGVPLAHSPAMLFLPVVTPFDRVVDVLGLEPRLTVQTYLSIE